MHSYSTNRGLLTYSYHSRGDQRTPQKSWSRLKEKKGTSFMGPLLVYVQSKHKNSTDNFPEHDKCLSVLHICTDQTAGLSNSFTSCGIKSCCNCSPQNLSIFQPSSGASMRLCLHSSKWWTIHNVQSGKQTRHVFCGRPDCMIGISINGFNCDGKSRGAGIQHCLHVCRRGCPLHKSLHVCNHSIQKPSPFPNGNQLESMCGDLKRALFMYTTQAVCKMSSQDCRSLPGSARPDAEPRPLL